MSTRPFSRRSSAYSLFPPCSPSTNTSSNTVNIIPIWYDPSGSDGKTEDILGKPEPGGGAVLPDGKSESPESKESNRQFSCPILRAIKKVAHSTNMKQLIPFRLPTMSCQYPIETSPQPTRNISSPTTNPIYATERPTVPARSTSVRRSRPGPVSDLTILPYTRDEWRKIMEEVKVLYCKGQYKHCSMRCKQVLNGIKDPYRVHPLCTIYLSFFAASSLEITASFLHHNSSAKLPLYRQALAYYQKAEDGLEFASFSTDPTVIPIASHHSHAPRRAGSLNSYHMTHHASNSSISSMNSLLSSADSVFSLRSSSSCSTASLYTSSPSHESIMNVTPRCSSMSATSPCSSSSSIHSLPDSSKSTRHRKKVTFAFSPTLPILLSENDIPPATIDASTLISSFPTPPCTPTPPDSPELPLSLQSSPAHLRYKMHLAALSQQLTYHITSLHSSINQLSVARAPRRSNSPHFSVGVLLGGIDAPRVPSRMDVNSGDEQSEERQIPDTQARITKLRANGWQRKRFDPTRYRDLCERALYEVVESDYY